MRKKLNYIYYTYFVEIQTLQLCLSLFIIILLIFGIWSGTRQRDEIKEVQKEINLKQDSIYIKDAENLIDTINKIK